MKIYNATEMKAMFPDQLQETLDDAMHHMIYWMNYENSPEDTRIAIHGRDPYLSAKEGKDVYGIIGYDLVALRYIWFLYKRATIPDYITKDM